LRKLSRTRERENSSIFGPKSLCRMRAGKEKEEESRSNIERKYITKKKTTVYRRRIYDKKGRTNHPDGKIRTLQ